MRGVAKTLYPLRCIFDQLQWRMEMKAKLTVRKLAKSLCLVAFILYIIGSLYIGFIWMTKEIDTGKTPGKS